MNILIVDDHPLIREGLANVLAELDPEVHAFEAASAGEALAASGDHAPFSLVLLDLALPGADGMSLLEQLRRTRPDVPVVVLSANDQRDVVLSAIDSGAMGFISKRSATPVLVNALRLVLAGGVYVPPQVIGAAAPLAPAPGAGATAPQLSAAAPAAMTGSAPRTLADLGLTDRQAEVLALIVQGKPNKLICRDLDLAEGTVKTHISAILRALDVANRTQAVFKLSKLGIQLPALAIRPKRSVQ
ncbi:MAG: response regulator transcription factor [Burkholderiales bacterium]|jgi:DNA-binding NarL/FixJ family response regulator|nr:response regulator transcription factor [Burkholderiales bacterium]